MCTSPDGLAFDRRDCIAWADIPNMHWDSWYNMFYDAAAAEVCHYMTQPLVELYEGCMVVLKVS